MEGAHLGGTNPQVPVEAIGNGHRLGRPRHALRPDRPVRPALHLADLADRAGVEPLLHQAQPLLGVSLIAHLGHDLVLARGLGQGACFADRARQRLLDVDVLAELHRRHRDDRVGVIGRGDEHRVDVLLLLEHRAEILVKDRLRELVGGAAPLHRRGCRVALVAVAERDDVVGFDDVHQVGRAHAVLVADDGDVHGVARGLEARASQHVARNDHDPGGGACRGAHEPAARRPGG